MTEDKSSSQEATTEEIILEDKEEKPAPSSKDSAKQAWTEPADKPSEVVSSEETPSSNDNVEETIPDIEEDKVPLAESHEEGGVRVKQAWTESENDLQKTHSIGQHKDKEDEAHVVESPGGLTPEKNEDKDEVQPSASPGQSFLEN